MNSTSKMPKSDPKEKVANCKYTPNIPSKTKSSSTMTDKRSRENASSIRRTNSIRIPLASSKVPVRLPSRASGQIKTSSAIPSNKNINKNKCILNNKLPKKICNESAPFEEGKVDSNLSTKKSCGVKINSVPQSNSVVNTFHTQSRTRCLPKTDKDEKRLHAKHTIQPKVMMTNKGILKEYCQSWDDFNNGHLSEGDLILDSKAKICETGKTSKPRKVKFKNISSSDLLTISEGNANLMDNITISPTECEFDTNEFSSPQANYEPPEKQTSRDCEEGNDCKKLENLSFLSDEALNDTSTLSTEKLSDGIEQNTEIKLLEPNIEESQIKTEQSGAPDSKEDARALENLNPIKEECKFLISDLKNIDYLSVDESSGEKHLGRRQILHKQIDEKIEILTAEFLKHIKEKRRRNPRSLIPRKEKLKNASLEDTKSHEPCSKVKSPLQDLATNIERNNANNKENQYNKKLIDFFPRNIKSEEDKTLLTKDEMRSSDCHNLNQGDIDVMTPSMPSRIPRSMNSMNDSSSPLFQVDLSLNMKILEKEESFSPAMSQKLIEQDKNETKYYHFHDQNLSKSETDKIALLTKQFDNLKNTSGHDLHEEGQLKDPKTRHSLESLKKNINSENLLTGEISKKSFELHSTDEHKDMGIVKKLKSCLKYSNEQIKYIPKFNIHNSDLQEKSKEDSYLETSNNAISLGADIENRSKTYRPLENKTHSVHSSGDESKNESILQYEDKENIKYDSGMKLLFSQHKTHIFFFALMFIFSALLFMGVFL